MAFYTGNPLAVIFLLDPNTTIPTIQHLKQTIAREFIIHPRTGPHRRIDIFTFTPTDELPFAGHPTIGAASWFLCHSPDGDPIDCLITRSGEIPISIQPPSQPGTTPDPTTEVVAHIAHNVHLHAARFPLKELLRLEGSLARFFPCAGAGAGEISIPRVLDREGDVLDPGGVAFVGGAGGCVASAASGLRAYLALTGRKEVVSRCDVVQGAEMGRRSEIGVEVAVKGEVGIEYLDLKGAAVKVPEGRGLVPPE
ncbi:hypothetical protein BO94DRAFT_590352 [Aspergillus sclerotioniger CBS 115572]|uniref:Diaminopimelate epimerase-like protein n=1 Tax=Aspergillus sclerotioniger CBS 115572 TaxID=1450535 RepID=A0A317V680_9EURO|nr:hypothetical protein BO94DRAFT_590352 [Aspergillus sclerotioniger CBS 115572]PWY69844.1 hypothetical protein BO94DRAFT_590352 [Aspergillus sclerotioniger CBS 115572]